MKIRNKKEVKVLSGYPWRKDIPPEKSRAAKQSNNPKSNFIKPFVKAKANAKYKKMYEKDRLKSLVIGKPNRFKNIAEKPEAYMRSLSIIAMYC